MGISMVRTSIAFLVKAFDSEMQPLEYDMWGIIFQVVLCIYQFLYVTFNLLFVLMGLMDFQRRFFLIKALSSMI